jgi:hypothetical protein
VSVTPTPTPTVSVTPTPTPTVSVTPTPTPTVSVTPTPTPTVSPSALPSSTPSTPALRTQTISFSAPASLNGNTTPYGLEALSTSGLAIDFISNTLSICTANGGLLVMVTEGECSITAKQIGSSSYLAATSVTRLISLSKGSQTINFAPTSTLQFNSAPYTLQATASSGFPVTFTNNTPNVCAINDTTLTVISLGLCSITASQSGSGLISPAVEVTQLINVVKNSQSLFITNFGTGVFSQNSPLILSATSWKGFDLLFINNTENVCTLGSPRRIDGLSPSFKVETLVTMVNGGICNITARVSGNEFYDSAQVNRDFRAERTSQKIVFSLPSTLNTANFPYNLTATSDSGLPVSYQIESNSLCTLSGSTLFMVSTGYCLVTAVQSGNGLYNPAASIQRLTLLSKSAGTINIITPGLAAQQRGTPWVVETSDGVINLEATSSSGTQPYGVSWTPNTCTFTGLTLNHLGGSLCQFNIYAPAAGNWLESVSRALEISFRRI